MARCKKDSAWIHQRMDELSRILVLAEPSDLPVLADLHNRMQQIEQWAAAESEQVVVEAVKATASLIEGIVLEEVSDPQAAFEVVGRSISSLQAILLEGRSPAEADFPRELKIVGEPEPVAEESLKTDESLTRPAGTYPELPAHIDEAIFSEFLARQDSVLEEMESYILELEKPGRADSAGALRRLLHTLKGEAALLGLADVEKACHGAEDLLGQPVGDSLTDTLLGLKDWLAKVFVSFSGKARRPGPWRAPADAGPGKPSVKEPSAAREDAKQSKESSDGVAGTASVAEGDPSLYSEFIGEAREHLDAVDIHLLTLETDPANEDALHSVFRSFHTIKGVAGMLGLDQIGTLAHEAESLLDRMRKRELTISCRRIDIIFETTDTLKRMVEGLCESLRSGEPIHADPELPNLLGRLAQAARGGEEAESEPAAGGAGQPRARLGEILVENGSVTAEDVEHALQRQQEDPNHPRLGQVLVEEKKVAAREVVSALRAQTAPAGQPAVQVKETVKVDADRLDRLVEMIGELVIAESMVSQSADIREMNSAGLARQLSELDKITRELQEMGTSLRMVPLRGIFQKMARLVRDLAKKSGKQVDFVMAGEDAELDKTVVDRIGDPLVHMVRNAVDHGLEASAEERRRLGKSDCGRVELRAFHKGGNIYIEIEDDGRGLDRDAILAKGRERGLIGESETPSDRELYNMIFQAGFSTAKKVTDVSGRGVGMDVVKRNIDSLRGQIEIRTEIGKGSTFSIRLPLTLAIIDGMVVRVGPRALHHPHAVGHYLATARAARALECFRPGADAFAPGPADSRCSGWTRFSRSRGRNRIQARRWPWSSRTTAGRWRCWWTNCLASSRSSSRTLGESIRGIPGVSGGAIMPDGRVGLILDVGGVMRLAQVGQYG